jgi:uncharacterized protein
MELSIGKNTLPIEVRDTPTQIQLGMMGRKKLVGGMLFVFSEVREQSFWMKNCLIPLDIIMLVNRVVTHIHHDCHPCITNQCNSYQGIGNEVLELNGGDAVRLGIEEGDTLNFM